MKIRRLKYIYEYENMDMDTELSRSSIDFHDHCPALQLSGFNASKSVCAVCVVPLFWYSRHN